MFILCRFLSSYLICLIAFISGRALAKSLSRHDMQLQYGGPTTKTMTMSLYDRPGIDFELNKGDLWKFSLSCITLSSIRRVSIVVGGIDRWNIESIVTLVSESSVGRIQVLTQDFDVFHWIDSDGSSSDQRFDLTLSTTDISAGICGNSNNYWSQFKIIILILHLCTVDFD